MKKPEEYAAEVMADEHDLVAMDIEGRIEGKIVKAIREAQTAMQYVALDAAAKLLKQNGRVQAANFLTALVSDLKTIEAGKSSQFPLLQAGGHLLSLSSGRR